MYKAKELINIIIGKENALLKSHKTNEQSFFGIGKIWRYKIDRWRFRIYGKSAVVYDDRRPYL